MSLYCLHLVLEYYFYNGYANSTNIKVLIHIYVIRDKGNELEQARITLLNSWFLKYFNTTTIPYTIWKKK